MSDRRYTTHASYADRAVARAMLEALKIKHNIKGKN